MSKLAVMPNADVDLNEEDLTIEDAFDTEVRKVVNRPTVRREALAATHERFLEQQRDVLVRMEADRNVRIKEIEDTFDRQVAEKNEVLNELLRRTKDITVAINLLRQEQANRKKEVVSQYEKDVDNQNVIIAAQASAVAILKDKK